MSLKLPYWIQRADFSSTNFEPLDLVEAETILRDHDWASELRLMKSLQAEGKKLGEQCCMPGIGFVGADAILHICPQDDRTAKCFLIQEASAYARATAEHVGGVAYVTDPDAVRWIDDAPLLLQYRLMQLLFRPDVDALLYLFDEYIGHPADG